jgi:hypothetical protein
VNVTEVVGDVLTFTRPNGAFAIIPDLNIAAVLADQVYQLGAVIHPTTDLGGSVDEIIHLQKPDGTLLTQAGSLPFTANVGGGWFYHFEDADGSLDTADRFFVTFQP